MKKERQKNSNRIALAAALMVLCAWVAIPGPVPFTLQTFGVFVTAGLLGEKKGSAAVLIYILLGAIGIPVFSGGRGGVGIIAGETGGYIIGFLPAVFVGGILCKKNRNSMAWICFSLTASLVICYITGGVWAFCMFFSANPVAGAVTVLSKHILSFIIPDVLKLVLAAFLIKKLTVHGFRA